MAHQFDLKLAQRHHWHPLAHKLAYITLATCPAYQSHHQPVAKGNLPSVQEAYLVRQIELRIHYASQKTIQLRLQQVGQHEIEKLHQTPYATFHQT